MLLDLVLVPNMHLYAFALPRIFLCHFNISYHGIHASTFFFYLFFKYSYYPFLHNSLVESSVRCYNDVYIWIKFRFPKSFTCQPLPFESHNVDLFTSFEHVTCQVHLWVTHMLVISSLLRLSPNTVRNSIT